MYLHQFLNELDASPILLFRAGGGSLAATAHQASCYPRRCLDLEQMDDAGVHRLLLNPSLLALARKKLSQNASNVTGSIDIVF
jgi:hypothetical protein